MLYFNSLCCFLNALTGALSAFVFFEKISSRVGSFYCNMSEVQMPFWLQSCLFHDSGLESLFSSI